MEQLVSNIYYKETYKGTLITLDADIDRHLQMAEIQLNDMTRNKITLDLDEVILDRVKMAICYQADFHYQNGGDFGNVSGFSVDGLSISYQSGSSVKHISETAHLLIKTTGLLSRIL